MLPTLPPDDEMRLATPRLDLVPLTADHAMDLFPVLNDSELGRWTGENPPADVDALRTRFALWESRRSPDGDELWLNWVVRRRDDDRAIGHMQATVGCGCASVAWVIGAHFQRQGYASEAARASTAWLLEELGLSTIVALIHPGNVASQTVAHRIGLHPTDRSDNGQIVWEWIRPERSSG